jgi:hypothetical protein
MKKVSLDTLQHGAVVDLFDSELERVLANIADENTKPNEARKITIELTIKPDKTRRTAETILKVHSRIAGIKPQESFLFFDRESSSTQLLAFEDEPGPELPAIPFRVSEAK